MTRFVYELVSQAKLFCICCINEGVGKFLLPIVLGGEKCTKCWLLIPDLPVGKQVA